MDRDELIFQEYKLYTEQKENFIARNFKTNRFYMTALVAIIIAMIMTGNVVFMGKISATLIFALIGLGECILWWMNVDTYNTLIKVKYTSVIEVLEEKLPVKPFSDEYKGINDFKNKKVFMFSDIQKIIAVLGALFFFAVVISEITPIFVGGLDKIINGI